MTHICVSYWTIISSDNGFSPGRRQAIIWTNAGILLIRSLGTNFSEILSEINTFSFKKMHLKMSSRPQCVNRKSRKYLFTEIPPRPRTYIHIYKCCAYAYTYNMNLKDMRQNWTCSALLDKIWNPWKTNLLPFTATDPLYPQPDRQKPLFFWHRDIYLWPVSLKSAFWLNAHVLAFMIFILKAIQTETHWGRYEMAAISQTTF